MVVFNLTSEVLSAEFGSNLSERCLQSSAIIKDLLCQVGVKAEIVSGETCLPEVGPSHFQWGGFWGTAWHAWVETEFIEIIDLTISHLHLHPYTTNKTLFPPPAVWLNAQEPVEYLFYFPDGKLKAQLPDQDEVQLKHIKRTALKRLSDEMPENWMTADNNQIGILRDNASFERLRELQNPWCRQCGISLQNNSRLLDMLPERIQERVARAKMGYP